MTNNVEWTVETQDDDIVICAFDEDPEGDVVVYTMDRYEAALLAGAIFETLEESDSD
jgi:hypothetical protein